ncbi:MAG: hypothetical protein CSA23_02970 [Deltaproteobacteria bacterium]|nr:MAG: hypothetical protein CSA23_02970 [Deltaproteobacteria bacterium]
MKKNIIVCLGFVLFYLTGTASAATTISTNMTVDNEFDFFISTNDSQPGVLVGYGDSWNTTYSFSYDLTLNTNYFIHIAAKDWGFVAGFIGEFTLSDNSFAFANNTQKLLTNVNDWTVYTDTFGGTPGATSEATYSWGTPTNIDSNADWIWTNNGNDTHTERYFSAEIINMSQAPVPTTVLLFGSGLFILALSIRRGKA